MLMLFWILAAYGCASIISWSAIFEDLREFPQDPIVVKKAIDN